jgi:hypothetical protein
VKRLYQTLHEPFKSSKQKIKSNGNNSSIPFDSKLSSNGKINVDDSNENNKNGDNDIVNSSNSSSSTYVRADSSSSSSKRSSGGDGTSMGGSSDGINLDINSDKNDKSNINSGKEFVNIDDSVTSLEDKNEDWQQKVN